MSAQEEKTSNGFLSASELEGQLRAITTIEENAIGQISVLFDCLGYNEHVAKLAAIRLLGVLEDSINRLNSLVKERNPILLEVSRLRSLWPALVSKKDSLTKYYSPLDDLPELGAEIPINMNGGWQAGSPASQWAQKLIRRGELIRRATDFALDVQGANDPEHKAFFIKDLKGILKEDISFCEDARLLPPLTRSQLDASKDPDKKWLIFLRKLFCSEWQKNEAAFRKDFPNIFESSSPLSPKTRIWDQIKASMEKVLPC